MCHCSSIVDKAFGVAWLLGLMLMAGGCAAGNESAHRTNLTPYGRPHPDAAEELSAFAFLVGSWRCDVRVKNEDGSFESHDATWVARYILDGRVIADEYRETGPDGELIRLGATYRSYDKRRGTWVMKWHDALTSTWIDLGPEALGGVEFDDAAITFKHRLPAGGLVRCTFTKIGRDHFTWLGELSADGGRTWDHVMVIEAVRADRPPR